MTQWSRIAPMVVMQVLELRLGPIFDQDSYGYRADKTAHQAVKSCRKRCWRYDWMVDLDIKGWVFDSIDHGLLMRAIQFHASERWVVLYLRRCLEVPVELPDGTYHDRMSDTPQGGVISPLLAQSVSTLYLRSLDAAVLSPRSIRALCK